MTWAAQQEKSEGYVVKKVALILVRVLKQEYPHNWPNVFADLFSLPSPYFFFSVMKCLDEEIVNRDGTHCLAFTKLELAVLSCLLLCCQPVSESLPTLQFIGTCKSWPTTQA